MNLGTGRFGAPYWHPMRVLILPTRVQPVATVRMSLTWLYLCIRVPGYPSAHFC